MISDLYKDNKSSCRTLSVSVTVTGTDSFNFICYKLVEMSSDECALLVNLCQCINFSNYVNSLVEGDLKFRDREIASLPIMTKFKNEDVTVNYGRITERERERRIAGLLIH